MSENNVVTNERVLQIDFFHDFLSFLTYISEQPIKKTATGNISRQDISALSDIFRNGQRLKFLDEEKRWPVRTEIEVPYLTQIKFIAEALYLTFNRKNELRLSKNGKAFLENLEPIYQYRAMIAAFWDKINWEYFSARSSASEFQKNFVYILKYLNSRGNNWIAFRPFCQSLKDYFHLERQYQRENADPDFDIRLDIHYDVIERNLKLFGIAETEETKDDFGIRDIFRFRVTDVGLWAIESYLHTHA